jgi:hypothetical protein
MKFETGSDLYFIIAVFVPGFIFDAVMSRFVPRHASPMRELFLLRLFTANAFNYGVCSPLIYLLATGSLFAASPTGQAAMWLAIIFVVPVLLALIVAWASQRAFWPGSPSGPVCVRSTLYPPAGIGYSAALIPATSWSPFVTVGKLPAFSEANRWPLPIASEKTYIWSGRL